MKNDKLTLVFIPLFLFLIGVELKAQTGETVEEQIEKLDVAPQPPGGVQGWTQYLINRLKYPEKAQSKEIEGTVIVSFIVEKDGSLSDIELMRGIGGGCDEEALRVVKGSGKWSPGEMNGSIVRTRMRLPIRFKLG
ncbi:MAG: energy transducer TonB [Algoriphagus sp.]|uniref:energy transducer TonB n=1 Tax=Algoriphagus sp. TaxID=1872435 RepID=UPI000C3919FC|nr:energy transducer TonB [Algoriphagus sp.]MAL14651.1 energy transducer TonB [Algoriphagus sp.]